MLKKGIFLLVFAMVCTSAAAAFEQSVATKESTEVIYQDGFKVVRTDNNVLKTTQIVYFFETDYFNSGSDFKTQFTRYVESNRQTLQCGAQYKADSVIGIASLSNPAEVWVGKWIKGSFKFQSMSF
ncbi:MAG: hypothetical protein FWF14_05140 [Streptococcaceae bacterium]|nr:hypothetical protein [Streptococcaceae bacterium]